MQCANVMDEHKIDIIINVVNVQVRYFGAMSKSGQLRGLFQFEEENAIKLIQQ